MSDDDSHRPTVSRPDGWPPVKGRKPASGRSRPRADTAGADDAHPAQDTATAPAQLTAEPVQSEPVQPDVPAGEPPSSDPTPPAPVLPEGPQAEPGEAERYHTPLYLAMNPDIAAAVARGDVDPRAHWEGSGRAEQLAGTRPSLGHLIHLAPARARRRSAADALDAAMAGFDSGGYAFLNTDLRPLIGQDAQAARRHWFEFGMPEGRRAPGWRPNAGRGASISGLLARPRGIDLYAPFGAVGPIGTLARCVALALADHGIDHELFGHDLSSGVPRIPAIDLKRGGRHRVSLLICEASLLQALTESYPPDHFAHSYAIGLWGGDWRGLLRHASPPESALDEVWVASGAATDRLAACVQAPVRPIAMPVPAAGDAAQMAAARAELGFPPHALIALLSLGDMLPPWSDAPMVEVARAQLRRVLDGFLHLPHDRPVLLVIQCPRERTLAQVADLLHLPPDDRLMLVEAPMLPEQDRRLQAAADLLLTGANTLECDLRAAAFLASGRAVLAPDGVGGPPAHDPRRVCVAADRITVAFTDPSRRHIRLPVFQPMALTTALSQTTTGTDAKGAEAGVGSAAFVAALRARLSELGLDAPPLAFGRNLGATSGLGQSPIFTGLAPRSRDEVERLSQRPFFDVLVIVPPEMRQAVEAIERTLEVLAGQTYALRRLHLVMATDGAALPKASSDVLAPAPGLSFADALAAALEACSGSHVVLVEAGAEPVGWMLTELAIGADTRPGVTLFADSEVETGGTRRRVQHSLGAHRLTSALEVGPMLCLPHEVATSLLPLSPDAAGDCCFALVAQLIARSLPVAPLDQALTLLRETADRDRTEARGRLLAGIAATEGARLLTSPHTGITRLAPSLDRLPPVTLMVTATSLADARAAPHLFVRLLRAAYGGARCELIADTALEGRLDLAALRELNVTSRFVEARGDGDAALRQRGLIVSTTRLTAFVDAAALPAEDGWLAELAEQALLPGFGAAGVAVACGGATPVHLAEVAAVDGACLLVDRVAALDVGGFDPTYAQAADVALCLALRESGARVVVVPGTGLKVPVRDPAPLIAELEPRWGPFKPDDFAQMARPARKRAAPGATGAASGLRGLSHAPTVTPWAPQPDASQPSSGDPRPPSAPMPGGGGGWRRSV